MLPVITKPVEAAAGRGGARRARPHRLRLLLFDFPGGGLDDRSVHPGIWGARRPVQRRHGAAGRRLPASELEVEPAACAPNPITASGRRRCSTYGTRSAPATSGWRGRAGPVRIGGQRAPRREGGSRGASTRSGVGCPEVSRRIRRRDPRWSGRNHGRRLRSGQTQPRPVGVLSAPPPELDLGSPPSAVTLPRSTTTSSGSGSTFRSEKRGRSGPGGPAQPR